MIDKVKELLAEYKVSVGFVAGALVVGTAWGSCSFEPSVDVVTNQTTAETQEAVNTSESTETVNANSNNETVTNSEENEETSTDVTQ